MAPHFALTSWAMDPLFLQPLGVDFLVAAGLHAQAVAAADPGAERRWAELVSRRRSSAATADEILASPVVASPLREGMCIPLGDSACAAVLSARDRMAGRTVRLTGAGHDLESHSLGDRDLTRWEGLGRACARAYAAAGIEDPATSFDLAEPSCLFPHEEALFVEASGVGGRVTLSPGGGLFMGAAPVAAGLSRLAAATLQVRAGSFRRALVHGAWGPAGQGQAVVVLEAVEP